MGFFAGSMKVRRNSREIIKAVSKTPSQFALEVPSNFQTFAACVAALLRSVTGLEEFCLVIGNNGNNMSRINNKNVYSE